VQTVTDFEVEAELPEGSFSGPGARVPTESEGTHAWFANREYALDIASHPAVLGLVFRLSIEALNWKLHSGLGPQGETSREQRILGRSSTVTRFAKLLVIAESLVFRETLGGVLRSHADQVLTAASARAGRQKVAENADISLVLSESAMSDGDGFQLLEYVASLGEPKPAVILLAARPSEEEARRAANMGAIGYLVKPITLQEIYRLWKETEGATQEAARRVRSLGRALLIDPNGPEASQNGVSHLAWEIRNVSLTGAFLETKAPLPVSTELHLALDLGRAMGRVKAQVIRVQEPSWRCVGGVGIVFNDFGKGTEQLLSDYIAKATRRSAAPDAPVLPPGG
jgi:CheY-like chemotaxis protein